MSRLFRGIYVTKLKELFENGALRLPDKLDQKKILNALMKKDWVVYSKPPFAGPKSVLNYLGRYTHKIAISNYRIIACDANFVTFTWRDYKDKNKVKKMKLSPNEFIRRFLSHVVPKGFMRIRSFGFLENACKAKSIETIRASLGVESPAPQKTQENKTQILNITGIDVSLCPYCRKGQLRVIQTIPSKFADVRYDTS